MNELSIRKTTAGDLADVLSVYESARSFMRENGNETQWQGGYPDEELIAADIRQGYSYVCLDQDRIVGVFSLIPGEDPTYGVIVGGQWLNDHPYATVHRIAVSGGRRGAATFCMDWCFDKYRNIRVDTHRDNLPMQKLLIKKGYTYCGIIYVADGSERLAYQKTAP